MKEGIKFYNEDIKNKFLASLDNEIIEHSVKLLFRKSSGVEETLGKDLYDMTYAELSDVAYALEATTSTAVYNNVLKIEEYIKWASDVGYRKGNLNPFENTNKTEWSKQFVATRKNYYFTRKDIEDMTDELVNYPDKLVLLALFEGIKGKGFSEILNLKVSDITEKNGSHWVHLYDDAGKERDLEISEYLVEVIEKTNKQTEYFTNNGANKENGKHISTEFVKSDKVLKKSNRGKQDDNDLTFTFINRKFIFFKEIFGMKFLKPKHITDSGIMHCANEMQEEKVLNSDSLHKIGDRFNTPVFKNNGEEYRNVTVIKNVIDIPAFETLYGYKMGYPTRKTKA